MHNAIEASKSDRRVVILIRDNGVGFSDHDSRYAGKGRGLRMVTEILRSFGKISGKSALFTIKNLGDGEYPNGGSEVSLIIEL